MLNLGKSLQKADLTCVMENRNRSKITVLQVIYADNVGFIETLRKEAYAM